MSPPEEQEPKNRPFLFPTAQSTVLPNPSLFFAPSLLSSPLPTNFFFQNFTLKNGDQPEYIHPYLVKSSNSSLTITYPSRFHNSDFIYQIRNADLTITATNKTASNSRRRHVISEYTDLSVTLDIPSSNLRFFLVRGCPFITCSVTSKTPISISTAHSILSFSSNTFLTKHKVKLKNGQTWVIYTSSSLKMNNTTSLIKSTGYSGIIRIAALPNSNSETESVLDRFSSCYSISGDAIFTKSFCMEYKWEKKGGGDLLLLAHPLHLKLLSGNDSNITVLENFKYKSIDGDLVGVVGDSWVLKPPQVPVTWHSIKGVPKKSYPEIVSALCKDVKGLNSSAIKTKSSYFYGKLVARAARLALIAEEVCYLDLMPAIKKFLKETIEPWLNNTFKGNGFLYESKWGGIVTKQGLVDSKADFGFGVYNDHHYHLGYFLYAIAVLAKIDSEWGKRYKPRAYALMADFMNLCSPSDLRYPRLRCFDLFKLHSWASGLTEFWDGRNQESTSEAVNAYYSAALLGLAYGDTDLVATGTMLTSMEIQAAKTWWHVRKGDTLYEKKFTENNRVVGVLWSNKRDTSLWLAPREHKECRLGIQLLPTLPISEVLFSDVQFARELVNWTMPALRREGVGEGWKGFVYALEAVYDKESALKKIKRLKGFDDGNSLTNLLWWVHSRGDEKDGEACGGTVKA